MASYKLLQIVWIAVILTHRIITLDCTKAETKKLGKSGSRIVGSATIKQTIGKKNAKRILPEPLLSILKTVSLISQRFLLCLETITRLTKPSRSPLPNNACGHFKRFCYVWIESWFIALQTLLFPSVATWTAIARCKWGINLNDIRSDVVYQSMRLHNFWWLNRQSIDRKTKSDEMKLDSQPIYGAIDHFMNCILLCNTIKSWEMIASRSVMFLIESSIASLWN